MKRRYNTLSRATVAALVAVAACSSIPALARGSGATSGRSGMTPSATSASGVGHETLRINFGGFTSKAELDYPLGGGKHPTVLLIPGSTPEDMNADIVGGASGPPLSHIFLDIARYLAPRGVAVLRYNKHYVTSLRQVDYQSYYTKLDLQGMRNDAEAVLAAAERDPHVDARHIFVYGWSEGSTVAAALVARHPEVAGLVVQGPVARSWRATFTHQVVDVVVPYLRRLAPDGRVTNSVLRRAATGNGGLVARGDAISFFAQPSQTPGAPSINPMLDQNHDGAVDINREFLPALPRIMDYLLGPLGPLGIYGPDRALPSLVAAAPHLKLPVLILQGRNDANVPFQGAVELRAALIASGNRDAILELYPGLGHTLGAARDVIDDNFRPIAARPLADLLSWLARHEGTA